MRDLDHISEVADGDAPHTPGGTPFQAWSLGELMRFKHLLNADPADMPQTH
ncbi:MAG: Putative glycogen debranching enzyme, archaeal type, TIGR01561 [uncultured Caballeronia sp.]|nr:MAG: Putative glycogen debranching enzyme, archaeal type, TIGR01561 [uncultured Caballeronia sp.]